MLDEIKKYVETRNVDKLISVVSEIPEDELLKSIELYEMFYNRELLIAKTLQDILAEFRIKRTKAKIPLEGNYTYILE